LNENDINHNETEFKNKNIENGDSKFYKDIVKGIKILEKKL
jgi:hypothetical protein